MSKSNNIYIQRAKKKRRIKRIIYSTVLSIIILVLVAWKSSLFNIKDIKLTGETVITKDFVEQKTDYLMGNNILLISKDDISNTLLQNPYVKEVDISRSLPGSLIINIKEATGLYYINDNNTFSIVSDELILLEKVDSLSSEDLVELKGVDTSSNELGQKIFDSTRTEKILKEFYKEQQVIKDNNESFRISSLDLKDLSNIQVGIDKITIYIGNDENIRKKMSDAIQIYKTGKVTSYINVSFDGSPDFK